MSHCLLQKDTKNPCGEKNVKRFESSEGHGIGLNVVVLKGSMEFKEQVLDTHVKNKLGKTIGEKCKSSKVKGLGRSPWLVQSKNDQKYWCCYSKKGTENLGLYKDLVYVKFIVYLIQYIVKLAWWTWRSMCFHYNRCMSNVVVFRLFVLGVQCFSIYFVHHSLKYMVIVFFEPSCCRLHTSKHIDNVCNAK